ncbi:TPA: hypothetical protein L7414_004602 [Escherichia coli]|nr:hypothetical protein [Escherichia coli]HBQ4881547.1 hypothetical protein [Escherichia coli]
MSAITKERLLTIRQWRETYAPGSNVVLPAEEAEELARIALASLEAEPVGKLHEYKPVEYQRSVYELTMLVKQLARHLKKAKLDCKLPDKAMDYLKRNGLISVEDVLR